MPALGVQVVGRQGGWDGGSSEINRTSFVVKFRDTALFIRSINNLSSPVLCQALG